MLSFEIQTLTSNISKKRLILSAIVLFIIILSTSCAPCHCPAYSQKINRFETPQTPTKALTNCTSNDLAKKVNSEPNMAEIKS